MIKYLVQHGDYSINYQNTIIARLEQDREIIATTKPSRERREAINFLHKHYDRYEADKKRMDARMFCGPVFNRRLFKYNQSKGLETFYPFVNYRVGMVQSKEENISDLFVDVELKLDTIIRTFNDAGKTFESSEWAKEKKLTLRKFDVMVRLAEGENELLF
ncbi:hypothetical protein L3Y34_012709 [Caenorhabditis briggsae]|uniref:Uncharacterized protein n=1 Tax=Caenorhabditis briggsae TaxID=6238 RepID=A0AAE8ZTD7_CAEBR|nr:hypothetical protein L3Y34_012709 [Caenorhabditis briggsae]